MRGEPLFINPTRMAVLHSCLWGLCAVAWFVAMIYGFHVKPGAGAFRYCSGSRFPGQELPSMIFRTSARMNLHASDSSRPLLDANCAASKLSAFLIWFQYIHACCLCSSAVRFKLLMIFFIIYMCFKKHKVINEHEDLMKKYICFL